MYRVCECCTSRTSRGEEVEVVSRRRVERRLSGGGPARLGCSVSRGVAESRVWRIWSLLAPQLSRSREGSERRLGEEGKEEGGEGAAADGRLKSLCEVRRSKRVRLVVVKASDERERARERDEGKRQSQAGVRSAPR